MHCLGSICHVHCNVAYCFQDERVGSCEHWSCYTLTSCAGAELRKRLPQQVICTGHVGVFQWCPEDQLVASYMVKHFCAPLGCYPVIQDLRSTPQMNQTHILLNKGSRDLQTKQSQQNDIIVLQQLDRMCVLSNACLTSLAFGLSVLHNLPRNILVSRWSWTQASPHVVDGGASAADDQPQ